MLTATRRGQPDLLLLPLPGAGTAGGERSRTLTFWFSDSLTLSISALYLSLHSLSLSLHSLSLSLTSPRAQVSATINGATFSREERDGIKARLASWMAIDYVLSILNSKKITQQTTSVFDPNKKDWCFQSCSSQLLQRNLPAAGPKATSNDFCQAW